MAEEVAMWKLRRLYARVRRTAELHAHDEMLAQRSATTIPVLESFCGAYDQLRNSEIPWLSDRPSGRAAVYDLVLSARMWMPLAVRDLPFIERANYFDSPISDDVLDDIERLITALRDGRMPDGQLLAYREHAVDELDAALRVAQLKWFESETKHVEYGQRMAALRAIAQTAKVALRDFLRAAAFTLTYLSPEYQKLLPSRAGHLDDDDDRRAPYPELVEPATLVTGVPQAMEMQG